MRASLLPTALLAVALTGCAANRGRLDQDLIHASRSGDVNRVKVLLSQGADLNAVDPEGWTPYLPHPPKATGR
jgi:hypothetical protein